jgi:uncharacterized protein (TIGR02145 family)
MGKLIPVSVLVHLMILMISCEKDEIIPVAISDFTIKNAPDKLEYYVSDTLDLSGLVITRSFDDGTTEDVNFSDFSNNGIHTFPENGTIISEATTEVIVTDQTYGLSVAQDLSVHVVSGIAIKTAPKKIGYYVGEVLDLSGLVITLTMKNGNSEDVAYPDFENKKISSSLNHGDTLQPTSKKLQINYLPTNKMDSITIMKIVKDIDSNAYALAKIGEQIWMAENLKTIHFNDGTPIPFVTDSLTWKDLKTPAFCYYHNDGHTYATTYGALYNWYTIESAKLCPAGWHVPTDTDWNTLADHLGGSGIAGGKLKATGTIEAGTGLWHSPNVGATNETGFTALPGGDRLYNGIFYDIGSHGHWWSATEHETERAWLWFISSYSSKIGRYDFYKEFGFSTRCIKD